MNVQWNFLAVGILVQRYLYYAESYFSLIWKMTFRHSTVGDTSVLECVIWESVVLVCKVMRNSVDVVKKGSLCHVIRNIFVTVDASRLGNVVAINVGKR